MANLDIRHLYAKYGDELRRYLTRRLDCAHTADDLTQETFARLIRSDSTALLDNPRAYLFRIASNLVTDQFRGGRAQWRAYSEESLESIVDPSSDPVQACLTGDEIDRLEQAIEALPARQREIIVLHKFEGLSYAEIAEKLDISKNTVMVHMMRALAFCRDKIGDG
ncbi:MAG: RNA polymerase sigma factor [Pseudomonadota bacterium]